MKADTVLQAAIELIKSKKLAGDLRRVPVVHELERMQSLLRELFAMPDVLTHTVIVKGRDKLEAVTLAFIPHSQWFSVEPLPDDEYQFTVKEETRHVLDALCE